MAGVYTGRGSLGDCGFKGGQTLYKLLVLGQGLLESSDRLVLVGKLLESFLHALKVGLHLFFLLRILRTAAAVDAEPDFSVTVNANSSA